MYLKHIRARNYRAFGDSISAPELDWELNPGLNILVGENDAGKTCIVDAIRQILLTTSYENIRLFEQDFHIHGAIRSNTLCIEATLCGLSADQEASVLEWLTLGEDGACSLILHLEARFHPPQATKRPRVETIVRTGINGSGPEVGYAVRELVRATYLKPLRDAEAELSSGRQSRLSQILSAHNQIAGQEVNDFDQTMPTNIPTRLVGLMAFTQHHLGQHQVIKSVEKDINDNYLSQFAFSGDVIQSRIRIAPNLALAPILEKFELSLLPGAHIDPDNRCARGLGYNNALFMATELVLLRDGEELGLLLVEEPEAHLHPQLQERVMDLLKEHSNDDQEHKRVQVIMTTHSPSLVSTARIEDMTLVHRAHTFPLAVGKTKLKRTDYSFLRRFIDATKANLFFARGVMMVEGPAEAILLPAIAEMCGRSLSKHGVSLVNVGNTGLYHYARILQREGTGPDIPIPVVCLTDRDIVPDVAKSYVSKPAQGKRFDSDYDADEMKRVVQSKKGRAEGGNTIVCVSDRWTLEYDLAHYGCAKLMYLAIALAVKAKSRNERLEENDEVETLAAEEKNWLALEAAGHSDEALAAIIYQPLQEKKASKAIAAQYAAYLVCTGAYGTDDELFNKLPPYLQTALSHLTIDPKFKTSERTGAVSGATISTDATVAAVTTTIQTSSTVQANATTSGI
ncbi:AAA family ATPase [Klebsiella pneumoniae]|uniref:ATP-dependent nuclease n=1 Tax=Klebsiella pneumoniae TaxID=573 RepID=UPI0010844588|nr:AAA family ATPase [Klebsiella pneumoniae]MDD1918591.1 AAA family ATPase [Klebsiella pneumoniae]MDD1930004.1 AAA family ATPase [Klebsiella pneumoniae]VGL18735.1 OLD family TOPRIM nucleotidyl transferase/hydrolase domain protein [Klebsiella pneumoniae]HBR5896584.1 AAA family ATPase [Klebsiella pneumoniae]HBV3696109.1 AAA family ATPase [Klebsiella pneumoniae]